MLELIMGRSGFGKTEYIRKRAMESSENTRTIMLLPDQMTFDTERYFLHKAGAAGAAKIEVFSFGRLCEDVFRLYGGITEKRVDDIGRTLVMSMAINACRDSLQLYGDSARQDKLTALMLSAVEEFKGEGIDPDKLRLIGERLEGGLMQKTLEIAKIYSVFEAMLEKTYIEPWDLISRAGEILYKNDYFKGANLFIDGFEGLSRQRLQIISSALRDCQNVCCTLCCDDLYSDDETSIFAPMRSLGRRLISLAREVNRGVLPPVVLDTPKRFENPELELIEKSLFAGYSGVKKEPKGVFIYEAPDVYRELEYTASAIRELVMAGSRYGDIRVICRDGKKYTGLLESVFERYEIPVFAARPRRADSAPLMRLVLAAFDSAEYSLKTEYILTMLKTGLCGIWGTELSELENYVFMWGITGSRWKDPFTKSPLGFGEERDDELLARLEELRKKVVLPLLSFIKDTKDTDVTEVCTAIYKLLRNYGAEKQIIENTVRLEEKGAFQEAAEQGRIWKELMDVLDLFVSIAGESKMSCKSFSGLFRTVLARDEAMDLPLNLDTVMFGTAEQIKGSGKITFLLGAVQGVFPAAPKDSGIFTKGERNILCENSLPLNNSIGEEALLERYYAYAAACSCSSKLYVSYYVSDGKGQTAPSELVSRLRELFSIKVITALPPEYFASTKKSLVTAAARTYRHESGTAAALRLLASEEGLPLYHGGEQGFVIKDKKTAALLFSGRTFSPSQIDTFHRCPFQYLCKYGLRARERRPAEVDVLEYGTLMHYIFENLLSSPEKRHMSKAELSELIEQLIKDYTRDRMGGMDGLSPSDRYRFKRMADTALVLSLRLMEELNQSKFEPMYLELNLNESGEFAPLKIETEDGSQVTVSGVVDRVDIYDSPRGRFVRVVDYKTGRKEFKLTDVLKGLSLQMLVYLDALTKDGGIPAGALYMPSAFPSVSAKRDMGLDKVMAERDKKMRMSGIVLDDAEVIKAMETEAQGKFIPIKYTTSGKYTRPDSAITGEELQKLFAYTRRLISTMAAELARGETPARPLLVNSDSCSWCPYISVCGKEEHQATSLSLKKERVLEIMENGGEELENLDETAD